MLLLVSSSFSFLSNLFIYNFNCFLLLLLLWGFFADSLFSLISSVCCFFYTVRAILHCTHFAFHRNCHIWRKFISIENMCMVCACVCVCIVSNRPTDRLSDWRLSFNIDISIWHFISVARLYLLFGIHIDTFGYRICLNKIKFFLLIFISMGWIFYSGSFNHWVRYIYHDSHGNRDSSIFDIEPRSNTQSA